MLIQTQSRPAETPGKAGFATAEAAAAQGLARAYPAAAGPPARLGHAAEKVRRPRHRLLQAVGLAISLLVLLPILSLLFLALSGGTGNWPHLARFVLPGAVRTTAALLFLVAGGTAFLGVGSAWLVAAHDFPLRRTLAWALVLPLAVPGYLAAYAFVEFFGFDGPVQGLLRTVFGFQTIHDYWFPDIRSTLGAGFILSCVLYPYVYLAARVVFLMQGRALADAARTLGAGPRKLFWRVMLPAARPAVAAGVALACMETINDIGASEYLGVRTLTFAVYSTWLNGGDLAAAAQIALLLLVLVFVLLRLEGWARRRRRFHPDRATQMRHRPPRRRLRGWRAPAAMLVGSTPVLLGFVIPSWVFGQFASRRYDEFGTADLAAALWNTVRTAGLAAILTVMLALVLLNAVRLCRSPATAAIVRLASIGYALPGGILGLGLLFSLAGLDNQVASLLRNWFGLSPGLILTGSIGAVVIACTIRFLALAEGSIRAGLEKLGPNLDEAARGLGRTPAQSAALVLLPLLQPAVLTALVLVFVDAAKELSATILLRPFGFNTLATLAYENASRGVPQDGAWAALLIIATALVPVVLLSRALADDRAP